MSTTEEPLLEAPKCIAAQGQMSKDGSIGIANHTKFYWHKSLQQLQHYVKGRIFPI